MSELQYKRWTLEVFHKTAQRTGHFSRLNDASNLEKFAAIRLRDREKSLRHFAVAEKFLDDNKPKDHSKSEFALLQTSSISFSSI